MRASANQEKLKQVLIVYPSTIVTAWIRLHYLYFMGSHKVWPSEILTTRTTCSCILAQARAHGWR